MRRDRYGTAREILGEIEQLHRDLSAYYTRLGETASDERLRMMLDYLVQREEEQAEMIFQTLDDREHDATLNTWETSAESVSAEEVLKEVTAGADVSSVEGLTAVARRVDQRLVDYFELLVRESRLEELQRLFQNLHDYQRQLSQQMQTSVGRFQDL